MLQCVKWIYRNNLFWHFSTSKSNWWLAHLLKVSSHSCKWMLSLSSRIIFYLKLCPDCNITTTTTSTEKVRIPEYNRQIQKSSLCFRGMFFSHFFKANLLLRRKQTRKQEHTLYCTVQLCLPQLSCSYKNVLQEVTLSFIYISLNHFQPENFTVYETFGR